MSSRNVTLSTRYLGTVLVVIAVVLAGCVGGIGGDGGSGETPTATETTQGTDGSGGDGTTTDDGSGDDGTTTGDGTTTDGDDGTTTRTTETTTAGETGGDADAIVESHLAGLEEAGGYTIELGLVQTTNSGDESSSTTRYVSQKIDLETGERYFGFSGIEYYRPPDSETVYVHSGGNTQEVPPDEVPFLDLTNVSLLTGGEDLATFIEASERTSGSTALGPATVYVVDSMEDLPQSTRDRLREEYEEINGVRYRLFVDEDTGIIAKYDYRIEAVMRDEVTVESGWEITELGQPDIETPEWVPDGRLTAHGEDPALVRAGTTG